MARKRQGKPSAEQRAGRGRTGAAADGGHAVHFLERVHQRVEGAAEDLALALYHQPGALRAVLQRLGIAQDETGRVAIALAPGGRGPWALVTGEGRFVTCLAAGMSPDGALRIDHERFVVHLDKFERDTRRLQQALALTDGRHPFTELGLRLAHGPIAREELEALEVVAPLLTDALDTRLRDELLQLERLLRRMTHRTPHPRRDAASLRAICRLHRSCGNLLLLLGDHYAPIIQPRFEKAPMIISVFAALMAPRDVGMLLRVAHFFARHAKAGLPGCKRMLMFGLSEALLLLGYLGTAAIAARQARYRSEVRKIHDKLPTYQRGWATELWAFIPKLLGGASADYYERTTSAPQEMVEQAERALRSWHLDPGVVRTLPACYLPPAEPDPSAAFALRAWLPTPLPHDATPEAQRAHWELVHLLLARAALAEPGDFCLPFAQLAPPGKRTDAAQDFAMGLALVEAARGQLYAPEPLQSQRVGRNDPCPCGSSLKYKRCCLAKVDHDPIHRLGTDMADSEAALREVSERRRELVGRLLEERRAAQGPDEASEPTREASEPMREADADATNQTMDSGAEVAGA